MSIDKTIACHISGHHFIEDGVAPHVNRLKDLASVNTLFVDAFWGSQSGCDMQLPDAWFEWPETVSKATGVQLKSEHAYNNKKHNLYQQLHEHSDSADMPVYVRILEYANEHLLGLEPFREVNHKGEILPTMCWNNPGYQQTWTEICAHIVKNNPVTGIHFGAERSGPLPNVLTFARTDESCCFCQHCVKTAESKGIDVERARQGFAQLEQLRQDARPHESGFLQMFRVFIEYPEVLAWQRQWVEARNRGFAAIRSDVKSANENAQVGFHIFQFSCSLDFFARASFDYAQWASFSDHLKPCLYQDAAGYRGKDLVAQFMAPHFFKGQDEELLYNFMQAVIGDQSPANVNYQNVRERGMGSTYVADHTRAAAADIKGQCQLWPGIGVNVENKLTGTVADAVIEDSVSAAFENGADGIVLCREYHEMSESALRAVGRGVERVLVSEVAVV